MAEGDDPRDPTTAAGMPPPWPVVDKHSTYERPPQYAPREPPPSYTGGAPSPSYGPPAHGTRRWVVALIVLAVLGLALILWLLLG